MRRLQDVASWIRVTSVRCVKPTASRLRRSVYFSQLLTQSGVLSLSGLCMGSFTFREGF